MGVSPNTVHFAPGTKGSGDVPVAGVWEARMPPKSATGTSPLLNARPVFLSEQDWASRPCPKKEPPQSMGKMPMPLYDPDYRPEPQRTLRLLAPG